MMINGVVFTFSLVLLFQPLSSFRYTNILSGRGHVSKANPSIGLIALHTAKPHVIEPFGKGLSEDVNRKIPHYISDFKDGLNLKSLSTSVFLFFACLAPAVAFGGLLGVATGGAIGTVETIGATAIGGILYALFSAQPLTIIGTTGPLLAFLKVLYDGCVTRGIPFLPVYAWTGLWCSFFLVLSSLFSASNVVEYFTRFTDEIFSSLISLIFIVEAIRDLSSGFTNPAVSGLQACTSLIIAFTTFACTSTLARLRKTSLFQRKVRDKISDFAPTLGVLVGVLTSRLFTNKYAELTLPMLNVPAVIATTSGRSWLVDIFALSLKMRLYCFVPALMAFVLLFMDQNITVRLIMSKDNKLRKGSGLHLDIFVVSLVTAITSVLGMPWMVAATVRSLAHLKSLQVYEVPQKLNSDGTESASARYELAIPEVVRVQEQRVTGLAIHSLIGAAIFSCSGLLQQLPQAVLTGLFLHLGFSSIGTTDLFDRAKVFLQDTRDVCATKPWLKDVGIARTKIFTSIQLSLLAAMWWIKGTQFGVLFPVLIGVLAPVRIFIERLGLFSPKELQALDGEIA